MINSDNVKINNSCVRCKESFISSDFNFYDLCDFCFSKWDKVATYGHIAHWSKGGEGYSKGSSDDFNLWLKRFPFDNGEKNEH